MPNQSNNSIAWKILNSWWVALAFVQCAWIGFYFIGASAKQKKWTYLGIAFTVLQVGGFFAIGFANGANPQSFLVDVFVAIWLASYVAGIVLSFLNLKKYWVCKELLANSGIDKAKEHKLREELAQDYREQGIHVAADASAASPAIADPEPIPVAEHNEVSVASVMPSLVDEQQSQADEEIEPLDINYCTESEFAALPGVTVADAKKASEYRYTHSGFASVDEFFDLLELKPHFIVQLEDRLVCGEYRRSRRSFVVASTGRATATEESSLDEPSARAATRSRKLDF